MAIPESMLQTVALLDPALVADLEQAFEPGVLQRYQQAALAEADRAEESLRAAHGDVDATRQLAHRLRGTAASLGLARLAHLATAIEKQALAGSHDSVLVANLAPVIAATRHILLDEHGPSS